MPIKGHATNTATQVIQLIGLWPNEPVGRVWNWRDVMTIS